MDQLTGEYKKPCLSPPMPPHLSSSMSPALAAGSPLAGGLRSQTCFPGWLASLIKEDRFFTFSFPPSLSLFFPWAPAGESGASLVEAGGGRGRAQGLQAAEVLCSQGAGPPEPARFHPLLPARSLLGMREEGFNSLGPQSLDHQWHSPPLRGHFLIAD